jgi:hypothetical protein
MSIELICSYEEEENGVKRGANGENKRAEVMHLNYEPIIVCSPLVLSKTTRSFLSLSLSFVC